MLNRKKKIAIIALLAAVCLPSLIFAADEPAQLDENVKQIALFKNGFGYFISRVDIPEGVDSFVFSPIENASLGTFWAAYPSNLNVKSIIADEVELTKDIKVRNLLELLKANDGKRVRISMEDKEIEGKLLVIGDTPKVAPLRSGSKKNIYPQPIVLIETSEGTTAIKTHEIKSVTFLDEKVNYNTVEKDKAWRVDVDLQNNTANSFMDFSYLARGITWSPSYLIDITDDEKATITAKAMILNDIADFENIQLHLVTGFPHLQFADIVSPFTTKYTVQNFISSLSTGQPQYGGRSDMMFQNVATFAEKRVRRDVTPDYGQASQGVTNEDLFFYPLGSVTLKKDQTGYFPLFSEKIPYQHIYIWDVSATNLDSWQNRYQNQQKSKDKQQVWHCLKLENKTSLPWTTAPAQTVKNSMVLGQDTLDYTSIGDEATLKITLAMDVNADYTEYEIERQRNAATFHGSRHDLVTIEGKLSVMNFKDKPVTTEVNKMIEGDLLTATPEAVVKNLPKEVGRLNVNRKLTWTLELESGESKEITYKYKAYVRN